MDAGLKSRVEEEEEEEEEVRFWRCGEKGFGGGRGMMMSCTSTWLASLYAE